MSNKSKKPLKSTSGPPICPSKDLFHRLNFTYQASIFLQELGVASSSSNALPELVDMSTTPDDFKDKGPSSIEEPGPEDRPNYVRLARTGMKGAKRVALHNQLKLDPSIQRTICKSCSTILIPGLTSRIRNRPSKNHINITHTTCLNCSTKRSIPQPPISRVLDGIGNGDRDGPVRRKRRDKIAQKRKITSFERERGVQGTSGAGDKGKEGGHELWVGDRIVSGWGVVSTTQPNQNDKPATSDT